MNTIMKKLMVLSLIGLTALHIEASSALRRRVSAKAAASKVASEVKSDQNSETIEAKIKAVRDQKAKQTELEKYRKQAEDLQKTIDDLYTQLDKLENPADATVVRDEVAIAQCKDNIAKNESELETLEIVLDGEDFAVNSWTSYGSLTLAMLGLGYRNADWVSKNPGTAAMLGTAGYALLGIYNNSNYFKMPRWNIEVPRVVKALYRGQIGKVVKRYPSETALMLGAIGYGIYAGASSLFGSKPSGIA